MIWNVKERVKPKAGDIKIKAKIALLPTRINSTTIIWLEKYYIEYQRRNKSYFDEYGLCTDGYWLEINRYIEEEN